MAFGREANLNIMKELSEKILSLREKEATEAVNFYCIDKYEYRFIRENRKKIATFVASLNKKNKEKFLKPGRNCCYLQKKWDPNMFEMYRKLSSLRHARVKHTPKIESLKSCLYSARVKRLKDAIPYIDVVYIMSKSDGEIFTNLNKNWGYYSKRCNYPKNEYEIYIPLNKLGRLEDIHYDSDIDTGCINILSSKVIDGFKVNHCLGIVNSKNRRFPVKEYYKAIDLDGRESYHADTLKGAVNGLKKKLKKIALKEAGYSITLESKVSIKLYRDITGACRLGCLSFCDKVGIDPKSKLLVKDLLPLLEKHNAYGLTKFKQALKTKNT